MKNIKLYQVKDGDNLDENSEYLFLRYSFLGHIPNYEDFKNDYEIVAKEEIPESKNDLDICEYIFSKYNSDCRPNGKTHRSMCVGDIVDINSKLYICKKIGFEEISF